MTAMLTTYEDLIARVESLGFMTLSHLLPGLSPLGAETAESLWHTGLDTDRWRWKDRAAAEKRLATKAPKTAFLPVFSLHWVACWI